MGARGLIVRELTSAGIYYGAGDDARPFLSSMDAPYLERLLERCNWAAIVFGGFDDDGIRNQLGDAFARWSEEFGQVRTADDNG